MNHAAPTASTAPTPAARKSTYLRPLPSALAPAIVRTSLAHHVLGVGRTRFWQLARTEGFPRAVQLGAGARARGYVVAELQHWLETSAPRV